MRCANSTRYAVYAILATRFLTRLRFEILTSELVSARSRHYEGQIRVSYMLETQVEEISLLVQKDRSAREILASSKAGTHGTSSVGW